MRSFALSPTPVLGGDGGSLTAESCGAGNGAIDPGETVTVSLRVENTGTAATVNLVGTLLASGGVASPGPPQSYGVIPVGGTVARSFTFRATGTCGGTLTASVQLQDGASGPRHRRLPLHARPDQPATRCRRSPTSSGNLNVPIPDRRHGRDPAHGARLGRGRRTSTCAVRLDHTFVGDLVDQPGGARWHHRRPLLRQWHEWRRLRRRRRRLLGSAHGVRRLGRRLHHHGDRAVRSAPSAPSSRSRRSRASLRPAPGSCASPTPRPWTPARSSASELEIARRNFACCGLGGTPIPRARARPSPGRAARPNNGAAGSRRDGDGRLLPGQRRQR